MVDAGVRGTSMLLTTVARRVGAMAMENSPPKPAAEAAPERVGQRAQRIVVLEASMSAITSAASIERPAAAYRRMFDMAQ